MKRSVCFVIPVILLLLATGCATGSRTVANANPDPDATPGSNPVAEVDLLIAQMFRCIEVETIDPFTSLVAPDGLPRRDETWRALNTFVLGASDIRYVVVIRKRVMSGNDIVYVFHWKRKHLNVQTGAQVDASGDAEWTFSKSSGRWLLQLRTGDEVF